MTTNADVDELIELDNYASNFSHVTCQRNNFSLAALISITKLCFLAECDQVCEYYQ